jgi:hypothetical protein
MKLNSRRRYKAWLRAVLQREDLSREDILKIIRGQLALPAREIDGGLLKECFAELDTPEGGTISGHEEEIWARIRLKISDWENSQKAWLHSHGRRRIIILVLMGLLLLALAAAAIAAFGYRIFGFPLPANYPASYVQEGAYELTRHSLAHASYAHVDVDILEAVYDGKDLRVVYSVWDRNATEKLTEKDLYQGIAAAKLDGLTSVCDWVEVDGQMPDLSDAAEEPGDRNGEMIYSIESLLSEQNIHPEGIFTVGLPLMKNGKNFKFAPPELTFTLNADDAKKHVRTAAPAQIDVGNIHIALMEAEFSPMSGAILLAVTDTAYVLPDGQEEWKPEDVDYNEAEQSPAGKETYLWGGKAQLLTADGTQVGISEIEYLDYGAGPGKMRVKLRVTPPKADGWPEKMFLAVMDDSGKPDLARRIPVVLK